MLIAPAPSIADVARAAAEVSGGALAGARVEPWPRGRSHHAFIVTTGEGRFVVRVHKQEHPGRMRRLVRVAALLREHDVPGPRVRWSDLDAKHLAHAFYIEEYLPGEDALHVLGQLGPADRGRIGSEIGTGLHRLHEIVYEDTPITWAQEFDERLRVRVAECVALGALGPAEERSVIGYYEERAWALADVTRRLTHDDLSLTNLLVERRTDGWHLAAFLDLERTRGRDPLLDLARLRAFVFDVCPEMTGPFEGAYGELPLAADEERARTELYAVYLLVWGVPWSRQSELPEREVDYRKRLARWLATR